MKNNETKHTPGPWEMIEDYKECFIAPKGRNVTIAEVWGLEEPFPNADDEAKANARLIVAAPDLLEALECYFSEMEISDAGQRDLSGFESIARAAIAKARTQIEEPNE